jgi:hypothetical protein
MKLAIALIPFLLCGCAATIKELKAPPHPYIVIHHGRAVGVEATVPSQTGGSIVKFRLGFFSDTFELIPCSTNLTGTMTAAPVADTFKLGSEISFSPSTQITEDITTGFSGQPPAPRFQQLFHPHATLSVTNTPLLK